MSVLDLSCKQTCPPQFRFDFEDPKQTMTGIGFLSYEGLRMYLITGSKYKMFLQGNLEYALQQYKPDYMFVPDLHEQLENTLKLVLARFPFLKLKYGKNTEVVWSKFGITQAEQEWVAIVRKVLTGK